MEPHFMSRIITGDETWVYGHDSQTKLHSWQWRSPSSTALRKQDKSDQMWKKCWSFSLTFRAQCIMNVS
jgi:hypothetical protein